VVGRGSGERGHPWHHGGSHGGHHSVWI